jgi:hypothetical protein
MAKMEHSDNNRAGKDLETDHLYIVGEKVKRQKQFSGDLKNLTTQLPRDLSLLSRTVT